MMHHSRLKQLSQQLDGALLFDDLIKALYATDASVYRQLPLAVAYPKHSADIKQLIAFAKANDTALIPRTAGTSLAGQCVGSGIVVDVSKHFTNIIAIDTEARTVTVEPGVVRDELNAYLKPYGLFFGPNTSTSNRCMLGGMVGNNSSGTTSIQYGVTRDKVLELQCVLSDGSEAVFHAVSKAEFHQKAKAQTLEGHLYRTLYQELQSEAVQQRIKVHFPKPSIHRRNTGYAIDAVLDTAVFSDTDTAFNMCQLLTGSEGTLAFTTQITLQLDVLPPTTSRMVAMHFESIETCLQAVKPVMQHNLFTCEMMDKTILDCTKHNKTQDANRQFIVGDPKAILLCEVCADTDAAATHQVNALLQTIADTGLSYANPVLEGETIQNALELRKAGLGLLGNMIGDNKSVACIEDTAVALDDLAAYISDFTNLMARYNQTAIYYAHAGAGELHLRPILNLKQADDVGLFRQITTEVAHLVKQYKGSLSGEHGDGRVRSEFIPMMLGDANYQILKRIKHAFDPDNIFNPGNIIDSKPMDTHLRYDPNRSEPTFDTMLDFSSSQGILREAEKCNGSGDCRKLASFSGTMCPSYRATRNEQDTTRARANALREFLTHSTTTNAFDHKALKQVFDLCLSCKACASECPSSVDVAALKAEFLYQYQSVHGVPWRSKVFAYNNRLNIIASRFSGVFNTIVSNRFTAYWIKRALGIATQRRLPKVSSKHLIKTIQSKGYQVVNSNPIKTVYMFVDEFTNILDTQIGWDAFTLLQALNYEVKIVAHQESGRAFISKGLLKEAKALANTNVSVFKGIISEQSPLIGIEPSAILSFKDDYLRLADDKAAAAHIASHTYLIEAFMSHEIAIGNIRADQFTTEAKTITYHAHCYQKALCDPKHSVRLLSLPKNYTVSMIPSGCCGMAGSFGYEKAHYNVSMQIGEHRLFPAIRDASPQTIVAANGTSCRHQIKDGTQRDARHPISILREAFTG